MNSSYCGACNKLVPSERIERDGKAYLTKNCPTCGANETLVSNDAARAALKRTLNASARQSGGCDFNCSSCAGRHKNPEFVFIDVTNRCNMDCPICSYNVPGMGFQFEPPMDYFDSILKQLAALPKPPIVCLFGGEPTLRKDLFDIIRRSRSLGLHTRIITNGLKLADEEYCRALLQTRVEIMLSYDGANPDTYRTLRDDPKSLELKLKALDNIAKHSDDLHKKITLAVVLAKGLNDSELPSILQFCHDRRNIIDAAFLMPLVHTWERARWEYSPPSLTTEDVERLVEIGLPGHRLEFLPRGVLFELAATIKNLGKAGAAGVSAHPSCESVYQLRSDGTRWLPWSHFLKTTETQAAREFLQLGERQRNRAQRWQTGLAGRALGAVRLRKPVLKTIGLMEIGTLLARRVRFGRLVKGSGAGKVVHVTMGLLELALGRKSQGVSRRHTNAQEGLSLVVLPLEEKALLETERLERCPTGHVYLDPATQKMAFVPACAWMLHCRSAMRSVAEYYGQRDGAGHDDVRCPSAEPSRRSRVGSGKAMQSRA